MVVSTLTGYLYTHPNEQALKLHYSCFKTIIQVKLC